MKYVLLSGLDGTGLLMQPFIDAFVACNTKLEAQDIIVVDYPEHLHSYNVAIDHARTFFPKSPFVIIAESPKSEVMDETRMHLHVLPTDLDIAVHMNNGRYLTLADLGRWDMMIRNGFWKTMPAISAITSSLSFTSFAAMLIFNCSIVQLPAGFEYSV
ncbi:hypothetical protein GQR58_030448 [Nymphon striatum]|nr:hypothetical protein GQR58_030448 [Nymphon striatum]